MTKQALIIHATPGAPLACDLTGAADTPDERIAEYGRLFGHALIGRERRADAVELKFAAKAGVKEWVADLARREAACCPFLTYQVRDNDECVRYEIILPAEHTSNTALQASLDEIHALPERYADGAEGFFDRLAPHGVSRTSDPKRFEVAEGQPASGILKKLKSACGC